MIAMPLATVALGVDTLLPAGGESVTVTRVTIDSRDVLPGDLFVAIDGQRFDGHDFVLQAIEKGAAACLVTEAWYHKQLEKPNYPCLLVDDTTTALGTLATYYRCEVMTPTTVVIAITGSNGKTTTKRMIDHVLGDAMPGRAALKSFNNHIGVPLTLLSAEAQDRYLVIEIGTNSPGEVAALSAMTKPDIGVLTSIGFAHLEGLGGIEGITTEKFSMFDHVRRGGMGVINIDGPVTLDRLRRLERLRLMTFGFDESAELRIENMTDSVQRSAFTLDRQYRIELSMPGGHHATNAAAAFAVARWFGLDPAQIILRLVSYRPASGRCRVVEAGQVTMVDDSYNANPSSMAAAIASMSLANCSRRVFVMGDMRELGQDSADFHEQMVRQAADAGIHLLVVVGELAVEASIATAGLTGDMRVIACQDATLAAAALRGLLRAGDLVWIKGSRAVGLDKLVEPLREQWHQPIAVA
ncbi:UDP-N-acetylmuramoyl-tripeptide--D-alanyl-D-alanine ligase [bacterium AH-315-J04]|nr:UDP-N-acetylmuramoyl-tripeptide--D-alanyl-D-alanine ligase [bacterium AH-315-J04]